MFEIYKDQKIRVWEVFYSVPETYRPPLILGRLDQFHVTNSKEQNFQKDNQNFCWCCPNPESGRIRTPLIDIWSSQMLFHPPTPGRISTFEPFSLISEAYRFSPNPASSRISTSKPLLLICKHRTWSHFKIRINSIFLSPAPGSI